MKTWWITNYCLNKYLQNENLYLNLGKNVVLKFLVWWRMVALYLQDSSSNYEPDSENFWYKVLIKKKTIVLEYVFGK